MAVQLTAWQFRVSEPIAVRALVDECRFADRVSPLSGHVLEDLASSAYSAAEYLCAYDDGVLVGVAVLPGRDPAELAVRPDARGRGVGSALLDAVLQRTGQVWAHGWLPAARAMAATRGLAVVRELLQMRRQLAAGLPDVELPSGVRLRTFISGQDEDAFLEVNARAFAWHPEQGRLDRAGLAEQTALDWFDPAGFFLAVTADQRERLLGYHWTKVHAIDPTPGAGATRPIGEIYVIGVDPESPIRGLGEPLSLAGLHYLLDRGLSSVLLYVEGDNDRAVRLYEKLGFHKYLTDVVYRKQ